MNMNILAAHNKEDYSTTPSGFIDKFLMQVERNPDAIALELAETGEKITYAELLYLAECIRSNLRRLGVGEGDRIAVLLPNCVEFVASVLALTSLGALTILLGSNLTNYEMRPRVGDSRPTGAILSNDDLPEPLLKCSSLRFALTLAPPSREKIGQLRIGPIRDERGGRDPLLPPNGNPQAFCHFTYKGFGFPVGAVHRYNDYSWVLQGLADRFEIASLNSHLLALPMYPVFGLLACFFSLSVGQRLVIAPMQRNQNLYDVIERNRIGFIGLVPILIEKLVAEALHYKDRGRDPKQEFVQGMEIVSAGSFLRKDVFDTFKETFGFEPYQGFGSSETLPVLTCYRGENQHGAVGIPLREEVKVSILNADGNLVENGRVGQVAISGPTLALEYINRPEETKKIFCGDKMLTGDLGYLKGRNQLYFSGRHMRFTKIAAQMADLAEIENVLSNHPMVSRVTATSRVAEGKGEYVSADVELLPGSEIAKEELVRHCRSYLGSHKVPRQLRLLQEQRRYYLKNPRTAWEGMS